MDTFYEAAHHALASPPPRGLNEDKNYRRFPQSRLKTIELAVECENFLRPGMEHEEQPQPSTGQLFAEEDLPVAEGPRRRRARSEGEPGKGKRDHALEAKRAMMNRIARLDSSIAEQADAQDPLAAQQVGFVASWMVHASLPYVQPKGNPPAWIRKSGKLFFTLQPGYYQREVHKQDAKGRPISEWETVSYGYPYGTMPRLILAWLSTRAVRHRQRNIHLGDSLTEFMRSIGKSATGGERGSITLLKDMMQRMFTSTMHITTDPSAQGRWTTDAFAISDSAAIEFAWNPLDPTKQSLWCSEVVLNEKFYESLISAPVPINMRIMKDLAHSPMAMDIYAWLTYRYSHLHRETPISWELLMQQFGTETKNKHKFKEMFARNLEPVKMLYNQAQVSVNPSGVVLRPSPTSVPRIFVPATAELPSPAQQEEGNNAPSTEGREQFRAYMAGLKGKKGAQVRGQLQEASPGTPEPQVDHPASTD